jgi:signal transduction histidine kinase
MTGPSPTWRAQFATSLAYAVAILSVMAALVVGLLLHGFLYTMALRIAVPVRDHVQRMVQRHCPYRPVRHEVIVSVRDSGPGIDPPNMNCLFNAFFTTKADGMGMGLSICRSIIESHGRRIWASNNTGPGMTFQFALPLKAGDTP